MSLLASEARAPGRICVAGEGLDWMVGGQSVVAAIDLRTTVSFLPRSGDGTVLLSSQEPLHLERSVRLRDAGTYLGDKLDLLQAITRVAASRVSGFVGGTLQVTTQLPIGAGLSSSAALTLAAGAAILTAHGLSLDYPDVCADAYRAENDELKVGSGWMDFLACAYGGVSRITASTRPSRRMLARELDAAIVLVDTGERRSSAEVLAAHRERLARGDAEVGAYIAGTCEVVERLVMTIEGSPIDYFAAGSLIQEAQNLLRERLQCSTPLVDRAVEVCTAAGAYAAKQVGECGGCLFVLCAPSLVADVLDALGPLPVRTRLTSVDHAGLEVGRPVLQVALSTDAEH